MKIVDIKQNTDEWLDFRKDKIGSSDFAVIAAHAGLCVNLYKKSLKSIVKSKTNPTKSNFILDAGHEIEKEVRNQILDTAPHHWYKPVVATSKDYDYIMASFDGYVEYYPRLNPLIIEIKSISENRTNFEGLYSYYLAQLAHQFLVTYDGFNYPDSCELYVKYPDNDKAIRFTVNYDGGEFTLYKMINYFEGEPVAILELTREKWIEMCTEFYNNYLRS